MTTVRTRADEIFAREGFTVVIRNKKSGKPSPLGRNGLIGPHQYGRKMKDTATVSKWRSRFEADNPGYTCDVL